MIRRPGVGLARRGDLRGTGAGGGLSLLTLPTTNLLLQLDARVGVTEGATFTWADQSGNGNDATQGTGANQPSVEIHGTLGTVVRLNGTSDWLDLSGLAVTGGRYTIYAVLDLATVDGGTRFLLDFETTRLAFRSNQTTAASAGLGIFTGAYAVQSTPTTGAQVLRFTVGAADANGSAIHRNGALLNQGTAASVNAGATGGVALGSRYDGAAGWQGVDLAFLGLYQDDHDTDQAAAVEAYLAQEWPLS